MARIFWNDAGERLYEKGLDKGVMYLADRSGVAWNGLRSVEENPGGESTEPLYFDGIKYLDYQKHGDFSATLTAITYPDEILEYEGVADMGDGLYADDQPPKLFHLAYRTQVGNDIVGLAHGYQIHILYNLTAVPQPVSHITLNDDPELTEFVWQIDAVPVEINGFKPTAHIILDSTLLPPAILAGIENVMYGNDEEDARLPDVSELISFLIIVIDNGDGTFTVIGPDEFVYMVDATEFEINSPLTVMLDPDTYRLISP